MNKSFFGILGLVTLFSSGAFAQELSPEITKQAESLRAINHDKADAEEKFLAARALKTKRSEDLILARTLVFELKAQKKLRITSKDLGAPTIDEAIAKAEADVVRKKELQTQAKEQFVPISERYQEVRHQSNFAEKTLKSMVDEHYFNHCGNKSIKQNSREQLQKALILLANSQRPTREKDEIKLELILKSGSCDQSTQESPIDDDLLKDDTGSAPAESGGSIKAQ